MFEDESSTLDRPVAGSDKWLHARLWRVAIFGVIATLILVVVGLTLPGVNSTELSERVAVSKVLDLDPTFTGMERRDVNRIGQADWWDVVEVNDGWQVTVRVGWGDCPSGCQFEHRWVYLVDRSGTVSLIDDIGDPVPAQR